MSRIYSTTCICKICGNSFHRHNNASGQFCSRECASKGRRIHPEFRTCEICQIEFRPVRHTTGRFCSNKCYLMSHGTQQERFWKKVNKNGQIPQYRPDLGPCWIWTAGLDSKGYASFDAKQGYVFSYEWENGPIPEGLEHDHLCRVRKCVRPSHLEPVNSSVNILRGQGPAALNARKTHCIRGHEFTKENTVSYQQGKRQCRICERIRGKINQKKIRDRIKYKNQHLLFS